MVLRFCSPEYVNRVLAILPIVVAQADEWCGGARRRSAALGGARRRSAALGGARRCPASRLKGQQNGRKN